MPGSLNYSYQTKVKLFGLDDSMKAGASQLDLVPMGPYTYDVVRKLKDPTWN